MTKPYYRYSKSGRSLSINGVNYSNCCSETKYKNRDENPAYILLNKWFEISNKICMDIGSSTGGFSDFLLQNNAKKIYAIDSFSGFPGYHENDGLSQYEVRKDKFSDDLINKA